MNTSKWFKNIKEINFKQNKFKIFPASVMNAIPNEGSNPQEGIFTRFCLLNLFIKIFSIQSNNNKNKHTLNWLNKIKKYYARPHILKILCENKCLILKIKFTY